MPRKKAAPKKDIVGEIKAQVVAELKPHIDEIAESAKTELRQIRQDILAQGPSPTAEPQPQSQPQAAPADPTVISGILKSLGAKPEQVNQVIGAVQGMGGGGAAAAAPGAVAAPVAGAAPATPADRQWQLMMMIIPALLQQPQGSPILAEIAQRQLMDSAAFGTTIQRAIIQKVIGTMAQGIVNPVAGAAAAPTAPTAPMPDLANYFNASAQYMGPIADPKVAMPPTGGPPGGTTPQ